MGLGSLDTFSLGEARERARKCRQLLAEDKDPTDERKAARARTAPPKPAAKPFVWCAGEYIEAVCAGWRNPKHRKDWENSLARYAFPVLGNIAMADITTEHVLAVLQPHWHERTETMMRVRSRIELVWNWAKIRGYCSGECPATWRNHLDKVLSAKVRQQTRHFAALDYREIPALMPDLAELDSVVADALRFGVLTLLRTSELLGLRWTDIDFQDRHLTIPPERMKGNREFRVPLTASALAIVEKLRAVRTGNLYVFNAGVESKRLAEGAMLKLLARLRPNTTVHGTTRSTFSTWCAEETSYPVELREACLAHVVESKVAASYQRGDRLARRRELLTAWERFCLTPIDSNVARLPGAVEPPAATADRAAS
jgi:integrase